MWQYINETYPVVGTSPDWYLWINYHDISTKLLWSDWQSEVDGKGPLRINSTYMGSLTTFQKMPKDWNIISYEHKRPYGEHCAGYNGCPRWSVNGVYLLTDNDAGTTICEKSAIVTGDVNEF